MMVEFYKHNIPKWMDGTEGLDDGEYRVYHVVVELIYLHDGPIVHHESGLAGRCNQHVLAFRRNLQKLLARGKLFYTPGGKLTNKKAETELAKIAEGRRKPPVDPPRTPAGPPADPRRTPGGSRRQAVEKKGGAKQRRGEKRRVEEPDGSSLGDDKPMRLPVDWQPSVHDRGVAAGRGLMGKNFSDEVAKFRNHWHAKGGRESKKVDWSAMWDTWVINWQRFNGGRNGNDQRRDGAGALDYGSLAVRVRQGRDAHRNAAAAARSGDGLGDTEPVLDVVDSRQR
jgi:uncharacterized protein DUF1376